MAARIVCGWLILIVMAVTAASSLLVTAVQRRAETRYRKRGDYRRPFRKWAPWRWR